MFGSVTDGLAVTNAFAYRDRFTDDGNPANSTDVVWRLQPFWLLGGNASTTAGPQFLGITDNHLFEPKVNHLRALRREPTTGAPNVVGGFVSNQVGWDVVGAVIGGGPRNATSSTATVVGGERTVAGSGYNNSGGDINNPVTNGRGTVPC